MGSATAEIGLVAEATIRPKDARLDDGERDFLKALRTLLETNSKEFESKDV